MRLFKRILILHIGVDQLGDDTLIVWGLFTLPQAYTRIVLVVHYAHIDKISWRLLEDGLTLVLLLAFKQTLLARHHKSAAAAQERRIIRQVKN